MWRCNSARVGYLGLYQDSEDAVRVALRTQQILAHESGVANTIDPLGGSYYIESLTDELEEEAYKYFDRIDAIGGVVPAIKRGFLQREISKASYGYQREIDTEERIVVGVNKIKAEEEPMIPILKIDPEVEKMQIESLECIR